MGSVLTIVWFLVALGVLVTVHEFGHFYVARRCGVRVLRFSVGFGKAIWSRRDKHGTEYTIAAIPLGGYVKMLDEREGEVAEHELSQAFNRKSVWQRIAIVAAGPIANFVLALLLFWLMLMPGTTGLAPVIAEVKPGSIAEQAGLESGQEIVAIDGVRTHTREDVMRAALKRMGEEGIIRFTARYEDSSLEYESEAPLNGWLKGAADPDAIKGLGIRFFYPVVRPVIFQVVEGSPAERAGLLAKDEILEADGKVLKDWHEWVSYVRARPGVSIETVYRRDGEEQVTELIPERLIDEKTGKAVGRVGVAVATPEWPESMLRKQHYSVFGAAAEAVEKTWETSAFVLLSLKKLVVGEISTKNLSGPITIAKVAGASAKAGMGYYIGFLALLSISLGVFNLLPIPVLDGGHLFYYLIEVVKGSPVSEKVQMIGYQIGMMLVLSVMVLALYNDIMRF